MSTMPTTATIVTNLEALKDEVVADKKIDISKKVSMIVNLTNTQIRAATLDLNYKKALARLPESTPASIPLAAEPVLQVAESAAPKAESLTKEGGAK